MLPAAAIAYTAALLCSQRTHKCLPQPENRRCCFVCHEPHPLLYCTWGINSMYWLTKGIPNSEKSKIPERNGDMKIH